MFANNFQNIFLFLVIIVFVTITLLAFLGLYLWYKSRENLRKAFLSGKNLVFYKISVPQNNEVEVKSMEQFYTNLLGVKDIGRFGRNNSPVISLEIVGSSQGIDFYVVCNKSTETLVEKAIHAVYSDAEIQKGKQYCWSIWEKEGCQEFAEYYLSKEDYYPIKCYEDLELDSLNSITSVMSKMSEGEALALQILIRPADGWWQSVGNSMSSYLTSKKDKDGNITSTDKDREKAETIKNKTKKEGFETIIRLFSVGSSQEIAKSNLKNLKNAISVLDNPLGNKFGSKKIHFQKEFVSAFIYRVFPYFHLVLPSVKNVLFKGYSVLNTTELATLYHFPNKNVKTPGINWLLSRTNIAPTDLPEDGLYIGISEFRGVEKKIFMKDDDRRRHTYLVGQTGTGKSELLKFLALQDIKNGKGIAFLDPHGNAVRDILTQIPEERMNDVIYFNPGDEEYPMGLNLLDVKTKRSQDLVINSFIELLYKLYDPNRQGIVGPQLERAVRNSMLTIMDAVPGGTLVEVMRLIIDEKYQKSVTDKVKDPLVKRYWVNEMANTQAFHKSEKTGYFVSKFDRFTTERVLRNIIGQSKSAFDLNEVMSQNKILLIDLNKGTLGEENSKFLGLLLVPRILAAAFSRASTGTQFNDFYLYVDEFQNFSTPDFVTILSEARKYKLNLIVANQFLSQMTEDIKHAIFGNVGTLVSFRVGQEDAKFMGEQFAPFFNENDLINLKVGKTIVRLLVDGHPTPPFTLKTDWNVMQEAERRTDVMDKIIQESRNKYGRPSLEVEKEIDERSGLSNFDGSTGSPLNSPFGSVGGGFGSNRGPFGSPSTLSNRFGSGSSFSGSNDPWASPFSSNKSNPNQAFSSGQTPFSSNKKTPFPSFGSSPWQRALPPVSDNFQRSFPSTPSSTYSSTASDKKTSGFSIGGEKGSAGTGMEKLDASIKDRLDRFSNPFNDLARGKTPTYGRFDNTRSFSPYEGGDVKNKAKRGTISLANIDDSSTSLKKDYKESVNVFNNVSKNPPPRPTTKTKIIEGEEIKRRAKDDSTYSHPKHQVRL